MVRTSQVLIFSKVTFSLITVFVMYQSQLFTLWWRIFADISQQYDRLGVFQQKILIDKTGGNMAETKITIKARKVSHYTLYNSVLVFI